ncbi:MAG: DUF1622 domain-containing protein [Chitinophagales bacterium]|nr:DUF1622 domain-containing protein [Chitinophagales bacterium]
MQVFNYIAIGISIAGSCIIIWGVLLTVFDFIKMELNRLVKKSDSNSDEKIRYSFSSYMLLGLDFMLAADIIHTIHNPVLKELYILAMIVAIRSVISFFMHKEMKN